MTLNLGKQNFFTILIKLVLPLR